MMAEFVANFILKSRPVPFECETPFDGGPIELVALSPASTGTARREPVARSWAAQRDPSTSKSFGAQDDSVEKRLVTWRIATGGAQ